MNEEPSLVRKTESAIDELLDLWQRRKLVCVIVIAVVIIPSGFTLYQHIVALPKLKTKIEKLNAKLQKAEQERDKAEIQLMPFLAAADLRYPDEPSGKRLELLLVRLDMAISNVQDVAREISPKRTLDAKVRHSLTANLKTFGPLNVEISCILGDTEGFVLASQIKEIFEKAGWQVTGVNQSIFDKPIEHLVLTFGKQPSPELQRALVPLFDDLGYAREAALNEELGEDNLKIVIGLK